MVVVLFLVLAGDGGHILQVQPHRVQQLQTKVHLAIEEPNSQSIQIGLVLEDSRMLWLPGERVLDVLHGPPEGQQGAGLGQPGRGVGLHGPHSGRPTLHQLALGLAVAVRQLLVLVQLLHLEQVDHQVVGGARQQNPFGVVGQAQPVQRALL